MNYETIGKFIQEKRKEKNLTQKELAYKLGVTDKAVSKWERGQGCPDVSILEILSKELGVSILEILKGRIIENEIIKVTEANDYIQETIKYTKNNIKETIDKIITFLIIAISLILLILNIENIINLNKKYTYDFDTENHQTIKKNVEKIEKNTKIILNNQGIYEKEDYNKICDILNNNLKSIKNEKIIKETGIKKYTRNEIYMQDINQVINNIQMIELARIIGKYNNDETYTQSLIDNIYMKMLAGMDSDFNTSYKYKLMNLTLEDYNSLFYNDILYLRTIKIKTSISTYLYLTEQIKKVGEIND
ncbi:MAG: helix-turn-helix domain-containing protein [Bacilli bacterium]